MNTHQKHLQWQQLLGRSNENSEPLPIESPPCQHCTHWNPRRWYLETKEGPVFAGVLCCHEPDGNMCADFSCFEARLHNAPSTPEVTL